MQQETTEGLERINDLGCNVKTAQTMNIVTEHSNARCKDHLDILKTGAEQRNRGSDLTKSHQPRMSVTFNTTERENE